MNKAQKTLHDLMLKILPFEELRQNDVCEYDEVEWQVLSNEYNNKVLIVYDVTDDGAFQENAKDLKLISRDWQLPDLLMANWNTGYKFEISNWKERNLACIDIYNHSLRLPKKTIYFDLQKSVLEQEKSVIKQIIRVLK